MVKGLYDANQYPERQVLKNWEIKTYSYFMFLYAFESKTFPCVEEMLE